MKIYLRIFRYAPNFGWRLIKFFGYAIIGIIFSALNLVLVIPMLNVLFTGKEDVVIPEYPTFNYSIEYGIEVFNYYLNSIIAQSGRMDALLFICVGLVISMFVANTFRYLERIVASRLKVDIVKNIRMDIFCSKFPTIKHPVT